MTSTADLLALARETRNRYAPSTYTDAPGPLVVFNPDDAPKSEAGRAYVAAYTAWKAGEGHAIACETASLDTLSDLSDREAIEARRDEIGVRIARGEVGPEAANDLLPAHTETDYLNRVETLAVAEQHARRTLAALVRDLDKAAFDVAPEMRASVAKVAVALNGKAETAEATARLARSKADQAEEYARSLYLPEALAALKAAGIRGSAVSSQLDLARKLVARAVLDVTEGWTNNLSVYPSVHTYEPVIRSLAPNATPAPQAPRVYTLRERLLPPEMPRSKFATSWSTETGR